MRLGKSDTLMFKWVFVVITLVIQDTFAQTAQNSIEGQENYEIKQSHNKLGKKNSVK